MLKGQLDIDIEMMGGTMIFIALTLIMFMEILLPLLVVNYNMETSMEDIRAVEFANLAKARMIDQIGDGEGDIDYARLEALQGSSLGDIGLASNYLLVEDLIKGTTFEFAGKRGKTEHDVYATLSSRFLPSIESSDIVMQGNNEYFVHIYSLSEDGKSIAVDIQDAGSCVMYSQGDIKESRFKAAGCDDFTSKQVVEDGAEALIRGEVSNAMDSGESQFVRVKPKSDISAGDIVVTGMKLGKSWGCRDSGDPQVCIRQIGDFVFPARIHVELAEGSDIVA
ncbi:MAG: hypothetical protein JXC85_02875 [Candidatus Aenigmarchaeota archaeon]|nr:hypothetical protein [Candidatus Aenigmarchaeota archaeon]